MERVGHLMGKRRGGEFSSSRPLESYVSRPLTPFLNALAPLQEHQVYPEAVAALVSGRVTWRADGVPIMWSAH